MTTKQLVTVLMALATLFSGCASEDLKWGWKVTDERLREPTQRAMDEWCEMSEGRYCPYIDDNSDQEISVAKRVDPLTGQTVCGFFRDQAGKAPVYENGYAIGIDWDRTNTHHCGEDKTQSHLDKVQKTIAHELGHALIDGHLPEGQFGVMVEDSPYTAYHVTKDDVALLPH